MRSVETCLVDSNKGDSVLCMFVCYNMNCYLQFRTERGLWHNFGTVLPAKIRFRRKGVLVLAWRPSILDGIKKCYHCSIFEVHIINKISVAMCLHHDNRFRVRFNDILNPCGHNSMVEDRAWKHLIHWTTKLTNPGLMPETILDPLNWSHTYADIASHCLSFFLCFLESMLHRLLLLKGDALRCYLQCLKGRKLLSIQTCGMLPLAFTSMSNTLGLFPRFITMDLANQSLTTTWNLNAAKVPDHSNAVQAMWQG